MADWVAAIAGALSTVYTLGVAGPQQRRAQKSNARKQDQAQDQAETAAIRQARLAEEDENRARQKTPDLDVLLRDVIFPKPGADTINVDKLQLGRNAPLGV